MWLAWLVIMSSLKVDVNGRPLLTFAIVAYKQEHYIREAVEAAFSQTYSPLQIILSDDCSPDRTFEIMQEMAAAYTGPHRVCLNRNPTNRHIGGHINRLMELAEGDLVVIAAGDDISAAERAQKNFDAWNSAGRPHLCSIFAGVKEFGRGAPERILPAKREVWIGHPEYLFPDFAGFNGSSHAWTKATFDLFGSLSDGVVNEDGAIVFRNRLEGALVFVEEPLVLHRLHLENTGASGWSETGSAAGLRKYYSVYFARRKALVRCVAKDLMTAKELSMPGLGRFSPEVVATASQALADEEVLCWRAEQVLAGNVVIRLCFLFRYLSSNLTAAKFMKKSWAGILFPCLLTAIKRILRR